MSKSGPAGSRLLIKEIVGWNITQLLIVSATVSLA